MSEQTHSQIANFIWSICNLLRGPYKRNEYRKVILPLTVLRRLDYILTPTKDRALAEYENWKGKPERLILEKLAPITGVPFYHASSLTFVKLLDDPDKLTQNLAAYIKAFSENVRTIFERFAFDGQITRMNEKNLLYQVIQKFAQGIDLSPEHVDNIQMGYIFEELIRIGAEQANEEAGEHFTPREVIRLMVNLLLSPEEDLRKSYIVKTIYDPACGTGGMLAESANYIRKLNRQAQPFLFGQDLNDEAYSTCCSDMLIKGEKVELGSQNQESDSIRLGCSFRQDAFPRQKFDYMLANPPFGVEWKQQQKFIEDEHRKLGYDGRFGAGLPRINDGSLLFLQHMLSKMRPVADGGSRIAIVFNGSPLFTGDAGSGESEIRRWIIENDWLEAIVALPDQLFYNTGIATYIWILTNHKESRRKGKIQLMDGREFYVKMRKSLNNKRNLIGNGEDNQPNHIAELTRIYGNFQHGETSTITRDGVTRKIVVSKIFDNADFGYHKITIERPLRDENGQVMTSKPKAKTTKSKPKGAVNQDQPKDTDSAAQLQRKGAEVQPQPDSNLRDTENIPLKEPIQEYFQREVLPYIPDAWIDHDKTKVGYEIPFNRHFYCYEPPRPLQAIEQEIKQLESEIIALLGQVTGNDHPPADNGQQAQPTNHAQQPNQPNTLGKSKKKDKPTPTKTKRNRNETKNLFEV